jgi:hypothetical protein
VELTDAARKTPAGSPAYATAAFHGIRLEMEQGRNDEARAWAEQALAAKLPHGAANAIQAERRQLARNWSDFLRYASMQPVAAWSEGSYADGAFGQGSSSGGASWWTASERASSQPTFDRETTVILDTRAPLNLWLDALTSPLLPKGLQGEFAQAGWTRAVILNRAAAARQFAARTAELKPDLAEGMRAYLGAPSPEAAKFEAAYFMLKTPGLAPIIREGFGRLTVTGKLDDLRDNWWAIGERDLSPGMRLSFYDQPTRELFLSSGQAAKPGPEPSAGLLSETQRAEGRKEWEALTAAAGDAPAYLCAEALRWARAHPDDPRVPEALHLAVRATRYGQAYDSESGYSRRAFELLHLKYPKSKWAEMTKYWF